MFYMDVISNVYVLNNVIVYVVLLVKMAWNQNVYMPGQISIHERSLKQK